MCLPKTHVVFEASLVYRVSSRTANATQRNPHLNGVSLINEEKIDLSLPFCGLVESQFNMSYDDYKAKLEVQLINLYKMIKDYLDIDLRLPSDN